MIQESASAHNKSLNKRKLIAIILIINFLAMGSLIAFKIEYQPPMLLQNQVGYYPSDAKSFLVKSSTELGTGTFDVIDENGLTVLSKQPLTYIGNIWDYYYYEGNFSQLVQIGNFTINAHIGFYNLVSSPIEISPDVYDLALERGYDFFYYQRSNCQTQELVPGYPGHLLDHMDDGIVINGTWQNVYGGWFSAGDYAKHIYWGDHIEGVIFSCLDAYERDPTFFNGIDLYQTNGSLGADGIPDILNEAMWGVQYIEKITYANGTIIGSFDGAMHMAAPERDTDQIIGDADDRTIDPSHPVANSSDCMWVAAGFAEFADIINRTGYFAANYTSILNYAKWIYSVYAGNWNLNATSVSAGFGAPFLETCINLAKVDTNSTWIQNADWAANAMAKDLYTQTTNDDDLDSNDRAFGMVIEWAMANGTPEARSMTNALILQRWDTVWASSFGDPNDIFNISRIYMDKPNSWEYFNTNGLGIDSFYLYSIYALSLANAYLNGTIPAMHTLMSTLIGWIFGRNPDDICLEDSIGANDLPSYFTRYTYSANNPHGQIPGAIPNGYYFKNGEPYLDLQSYPVGSAGVQNVDFNSNEPWLPHNVAFMQAFSTLMELNGQ